MKQYIYIIVVFYVAPTGVLTINSEPAVVGSVLFSYTMGLIAWWVDKRPYSWILKIF